MTPVSTLPVFWVFLEALSEKQSAEELEATSSSFSLPLSLSLSGSGPEGHRESRENGTIKINVEMKLNYKERKTLSLSKKNSVRFFLSSLLVPTPPSSFLLFLLRALQLEEDAGRKNQRETGREGEEQDNSFHWLPPSHVETFFQFLRAGLLQCPFGRYAAAVLEEKPLCGSDHAYPLSKAPGLRDGASSVMLCSQPCHSAGTDVGSWPRWQSSSP
jgi:hypothetical protein